MSTHDSVRPLVAVLAAVLCLTACKRDKSVVPSYPPNCLPPLYLQNGVCVLDSKYIQVGPFYVFPDDVHFLTYSQCGCLDSALISFDQLGDKTGMYDFTLQTFEDGPMSGSSAEYFVDSVRGDSINFVIGLCAYPKIGSFQGRLNAAKDTMRGMVRYYNQKEGGEMAEPCPAVFFRAGQR